MHKIWKYPFGISGNIIISMPKLARILDIQYQNGTLCMWALVDDNDLIVNRFFTVIGTGHNIPDFSHGLEYIKTVQDGPYVWHIFEIK